MLIFDILVPFFAALCASLGIGGGGLLTVYLVSVKNISQHDAQYINLIFFILTMSFSLLFHAFKGRIITCGIHLILIPSVICSVLGSFLAKSLASDTLKTAFGIFMILCGVISVIKSSLKRKKERQSNSCKKAN